MVLSGTDTVSVVLYKKAEKVCQSMYTKKTRTGFSEIINPVLRYFLYYLFFFSFARSAAPSAPAYLPCSVGDTVCPSFCERIFVK